MSVLGLYTKQHPEVYGP